MLFTSAWTKGNEFPRAVNLGYRQCVPCTTPVECSYVTLTGDNGMCLLLLGQKKMNFPWVLNLGYR